MSTIQEKQQYIQEAIRSDRPKSDTIDMKELKFISKVSTMSSLRYFIHFPTEQEKIVKTLKGKYVRVHVYEIIIGDSETQKIGIGQTHAKFISKLTTMGENRYFIKFPNEYTKTAKTLQGKYVWVYVQEIPIDEQNQQSESEGAE